MRNTLLVVALSVAAGGAIAASDTDFYPWTAWMKDVWSMHDMNNDGALSTDEVKKMSQKLGKDFVGFLPWYLQYYAEMDTDKNGSVTAEELHTMMASHQMSDAQMFNEWMRGGFGYIPFDPKSSGAGS